MIIDTAFGADDYSYQLTEAHRVGGQTIRIRVRRHHDRAESIAIVEVLTPMLTWTDLAHEPASRWHDDTPSPLQRRVSEPADLRQVANRLLTRAEAILNV